MKHHQLPIFFALLLALGLALMFTAPVFADDAPPPEQPAAPEAAAPPAPEGGGENGGEAAAPAEALTSDAPAPLAIAGGDLGILGPPWAYYYVGATLVERDQPQDLIDNILATGILPSNRMIYLQQGTFNGFEIDGGAGSGILSQMKGVLGNGDYPDPAADFTGYDNEDASVINSGDVSIHDTIVGFLLQGLHVTGGDLIIHGNIGVLTLKSVDVSGSGNEFSVYDHNGAITADSISMTGGEGAGFINTDSSSASVTITNSAFNGNDPYAGLFIDTNGAVTLRGIVAQGNYLDGIFVTARKGISVTHADTSDNGENGTWLINEGVAQVTVNNLQAHNNNGAWNINSGNGLFVETQGNVSLTQISVNFNNGRGIRVGVTNGDQGGVNFTGADLGAYDNGTNGIEINITGTASINGIFSGENDWTGIFVGTPGAITLNGVNAFNNYRGVHLMDDFNTPCGPVKILNTYSSNDINANHNGVEIWSNGSVALTGVNSHDNANFGISIDIETPAGTVTLTDTGASGNNAFGVKVVAQNSITWKIGWSGENGSYGALLDNTSAPSPKPITLENGWFFDNHDGNGLEVLSNGAVTLKNANAGDNNAYGVYIDNSTGTANVSVTGTSAQWLDFGRNGESGLSIESDGAVTISYISAYENGSVASYRGDGIYIRNIHAHTPKTVTASNLDVYNNQKKGLYIISKRAITVTNIGARDNTGEGAYLMNIGSGGVKVLRTAWGHNDFSRNGETGLYIEAYGPVTIERINAYENGWQGEYDGVHVDNCRAYDSLDPDSDPDTCTGKWAVTVDVTSGWNNDFSRNSEDGLEISSGGVVKLSNINAGENGRYGLIIDTNWLNAAGAATIASVGGYQSNFYRNGLDGATIFATGAISITNFNAGENGRHGLRLYNVGEGIPGFKPAAITVTNGNADSNHNGHGIYARSLGNILLKDVQANDNDLQYGTISFDTTVPEKLQGHLWDSGDTYEFEVSGGPLAVEVHAVLEFQGVVTLYFWDDVDEEWDLVGLMCNDVTECTIDWGNMINNIYQVRITGIDENNFGNYLISLNDDDSGYTSYDYIGGNGFRLITDFTGATGTVTVANGPNRGNVNTHNNGSTGTYIRSRKAISITSLHSSNNGGLGLDADNCLYNGPGPCLYVAPITLSGYSSNLSDNQMGGIRMSSEGVVYLQNVDANNNHRGDGAHIFAGNLTIKATNPGWYSGFNNNGGYGLWLYSNGTVTLDRLMTNNNGGQGLWISNTIAATPKAVSITNASVQDNLGVDEDGVSGLRVETGGAVTLKNVQVTGNHGGGAYIDNRGLTSTPVLVQQSQFNNNNPDGGPYHYGDPGYSDLFDGLNILTNASVTWNSSSASNNSSGAGVLIGQTFLGLSMGSVTMLTSYGNNDFFGNGETGLALLGVASANIAGINSGGNGSRGLGIWNGSGGAITVSNAMFHHNGLQGVLIYNSGSGLIKLTNVTGFENALGSGGDYAGAEIYTGGGAVSILNSAFHHNGDWGIKVDLNGGATLPVFTGTSVISNNWDGAGFDGTDNPNVEVVP